MTQKQMFGAVVGVAAVVLLSIFVYRQFTAGTEWPSQSSPSSVTPKKTMPSDTKTTQKAEVPDTIDSVSASISEESSIDTSALDEEEAGETSELNEDASSINNLENSYDENNF